jgi:hypothetical protein
MTGTSRRSAAKVSRFRENLAIFIAPALAAPCHRDAMTCFAIHHGNTFVEIADLL